MVANSNMLDIVDENVSPEHLIDLTGIVDIHMK